MDLRSNPRKKRIKAEDLTLGDVKAAAAELDKLREHFRGEVEEQIRKRLRELLRRNPDVTIEEYLAEEGEDDPEDETDDAA